MSPTPNSGSRIILHARTKCMACLRKWSAASLMNGKASSPVKTFTMSTSHWRHWKSRKPVLPVVMTLTPMAVQDGRRPRPIHLADEPQLLRCSVHTSIQPLRDRGSHIDQGLLQKHRSHGRIRTAHRSAPHSLDIWKSYRHRALARELLSNNFCTGAQGIEFASCNGTR